MSPAYFAAAVGLLLAVAAAVILFRKGRDALGFACLVAAPVAAALPIALWPAGGTDRVAADPHAGLTGPAAAPSVATAGTPTEAARARGEQARAARRWPEARDAFAELTRLAPNDADAWADLADATAAAANGDLRLGESALSRALALDPNHIKALWLQASLERQRENYAAAATLWERLLKLAPPGSDEAKAFAANLDEARSLAAGKR